MRVLIVLVIIIIIIIAVALAIFLRNKTSTLSETENPSKFNFNFFSKDSSGKVITCKFNNAVEEESCFPVIDKSVISCSVLEDSIYCEPTDDKNKFFGCSGLDKCEFSMPAIAEEQVLVKSTCAGEYLVNKGGFGKTLSFEC